MSTLNLQPYLVGDLLELRPLAPADWDDLFAVASDPLIWEVHPARDRYKEEVFKDFFRDALDGKGALVALDRKTSRIIGSSRYRWHAAVGELEIGWTFLARDYWGGRYNGEMKRLMLDHAFTSVEHVVFRIGATNVRSRRAIEKIGAILTDRRETVLLHGKPIEHVIYQLSRPSVSNP